MGGSTGNWGSTLFDKGNEYEVRYGAGNKEKSGASRTNPMVKTWR
jgi:hypothetical protein